MWCPCFTRINSEACVLSTGRRESASLVLLATIALAVFAARLMVGPSTSPWGDVWRLLVPGDDPGAGELLREFRLPQAIAAALVGAALAVSGLQMQTIFQNPLAGPWALGLVAGSQLGV